MNKIKNYTLGIDMGTNSIGWAVIAFKENQQPSELIACGTRIFQEVVDAKSKIPKNQTRRAARSARRLIARRKMRLNTILNLLLNYGLLPNNAEEREKLFTDNKSFDPYQLRKKALDDKLTPYEFGRVLYHLAHRRGFQSNRKVSSKEDGTVKNSISSLRQEITDFGCRTLGEYLSVQPKKRNRYTDRSMYQEEFEFIWQAQQKHYPDLFNQAFKISLHNAIFFQRPLKTQKFLIGKCTFELSRKRASWTLLEAQRFRILSDLNNLAIKNPITREYRPLRDSEREKLLELLERQKTLSWNKARTVLGLHAGEIFNLEEGKKRELIGNRTVYALRSILKKQWDEMNHSEQNDLITDMFTIDNENGFLHRMKSHWGFDSETAELLAKTELEPGYARLSLKSIRKILPYLRKGMTYDKACNAAGYNHSTHILQTAVNTLGIPPYLRNPVVQKALYETRKIINAILYKYGKPVTIRVEMARDMKLTRRQKEDFQKKQKENENNNDKARNILQNEFGIQNPTRADVQKYNMWVECQMTCPYTGIPICREMLFSQEVDVEHILPYSRSLDDSYMNKTLCMASENRTTKHNKTPYEAYHSNETKYQAILQRIKTLPWPKRRRFEQKEIDTDKFVERQLNDTRYICVEVKKYLQSLGVTVEVSKGEATAALRHRWNLNRILTEDDSSEKKRSDHRHHAIDAIVIALTSGSLFQKLSRLSAQSGAALSERGFQLDKPWPSFYEDAEKMVRNIIVSHAPNRKITGALHEDTAYGYSNHDKCFVYRKPLSTLTENEIEKIRDGMIKQLVKVRIEQFDGNLKKALGNANSPLLHRDGKTPIRNVRLMNNFNQNTVNGIKNRVGITYKFFKYGNNHHVEIIENINTGERKGVFVTAMEAAKRARIDKTGIVQRNHGPEWRFVMSLCTNDMIEVDNDNVKKYYRVQKMSGSKQFEITLKYHHDALPEINANSLRIRSNKDIKKISRKIFIDPLGSVFASND
ncbi:MAG: type II CRISPR RNA-guided endonuclease Cas9 [Candidatus Kuenenia sp.]|nr:type II CRISPR RNA-guided endonuclease Cas9 [Candidatus Kuenenia hertensis]